MHRYLTQLWRSQVHKPWCCLLLVYSHCLPSSLFMILISFFFSWPFLSFSSIFSSHFFLHFSTSKPILIVTIATLIHRRKSRKPECNSSQWPLCNLTGMVDYKVTSLHYKEFISKSIPCVYQLNYLYWIYISQVKNRPSATVVFHVKATCDFQLSEVVVR